MKKTGIIHSEIAAVISSLGHTDQIVVADCGLPIPEGVKRIDLALKQGTPSFLETVETILTEMKVEQAIFAQEIEERNVTIKDQAIERLRSDCVTDIVFLSHEEFKEKTKQAKVVIRTGEATPYANVILVSGVTF